MDSPCLTRLRNDEGILLNLSVADADSDREELHLPFVACHEEIESITTDSDVLSFGDDGQMISPLSSDLSSATCHPDLGASSLSSTDPTSMGCCTIPDGSFGTSETPLMFEHAELSMTDRERQRREKVRQKKLLQRQNSEFKERERVKARERMKALREDPTYRYHERQRDRERRKNARLIKQVQRAQERERDRVRKSVLRSLCGRKSEEQMMLSDLCVIGHDLDVGDSSLCGHLDDCSGSSTTFDIV